MDKKTQIQNLTTDLLANAFVEMSKQIPTLLESGAIDVDLWNEQERMLIPKAILIALMEGEIQQYDGRGTDYEGRIRREVENLRYFL